jgi:alpha-ketoglutarate-dependent taurine dioxygenase
VHDQVMEIADAELSRPTLLRGPFDLDDEAAYRSWRSRKLANYPNGAAELVVEVRDPMNLSTAEREALRQRLSRANMAVYASAAPAADKEIPRAIGRQFGLLRLDCNWLADEDAISSIQVDDRQSRGELIPYSDRPISWHTDGYYNPSGRTIRAMILHCVRPAAEGGVNALLDHELAFLLLRDENPEHVRALSAPDVMTIPPRFEERGVARDAQAGPVFSTEPAGAALHMRYTARTRSIRWRDDAATRAAQKGLELILAKSRFVISLRMEAGMGLLCANVLHARSGFVDDPRRPRLMYRARYYDRLKLTEAGGEAL